MNSEIYTGKGSCTVRHYGATRWEGGVGGGDGLGGQDGSTSADGIEIRVLGLEVIMSRLPAYWLEPDHLDRICMVMNTVLERQCFGATTSGFSPISERRLAAVVGRDFAGSALQLLCSPKASVLETDGHYSLRTKCRGFRFSAEISRLELAIHWISPRLALKARKAEERFSRIEVGENPSHGFLWRSLNRLTLRPESEGILPLPSTDPALQFKRHSWRLSVDRVCNRRWFFSRDRNTGRVFNNFTTIPKLVRPYALLDGRPCAEIDIRNSQPFFLANLYPKMTSEARRFAATVCTGEFYETVNEASGFPIPSDDRSRLKKAVFTGVLFGRHVSASPLWKGFLSKFPELSRIILEVKSKDYRRLAVELQKREANLMIKCVIPRLAAALPDTPFLTVHDSLSIAGEHAKLAEDLIAQTAREITGHIPQLRITPPASKHS